MKMLKKKLDQLSINTIRTLAIDAIDKANSGHPGMPMGAAPMAYELWTRFMSHNPSNPSWMNRDRFVLSAGHGSMLLYSLLHLCGYNLSLEELQRFRQSGSLTPGHPEFGHTPGVDATTGPLGQGLGMAVGMALAEAHLAANYNREGFEIINHFTYVICGDGDMMEGLSSEAASLAGHLELGKLIVLYDSNDISLDGDLSLSFSENVLDRFQAYNWHVQFVKDGNDLEEINAAISQAQADRRPSIIEVKTTIGYGSPNKSGKAGEHGSHGVALGKAETLLTKDFYGWPSEPTFFVPDEVKKHFEEIRRKGEVQETAWNELVQQYRMAYPNLFVQYHDAVNGVLPSGWGDYLPLYDPAADASIATRGASEEALNAIADHVSFIIGGSADLETSTKTRIRTAGRLTKDSYEGRNISFGVREFAMGAAVNGMVLHGGLRAYASTFLVFSDYLRPAIRLAAIMKLPVIYIFTHDSIVVGEDGPTHEPIEQLASLRAMPGINVFRPADANETNQVWKYVMENKTGPCALLLSRQPLPILSGTDRLAPLGVRCGAYVLSDARSGGPQSLQAQIIATGSEVQLAIGAQRILEEQGMRVRVISMPCWELFDMQSQSYRDSVIDPNIKATLAVEMGASQGWHKYVGRGGDVMGIDRYGVSAPSKEIIGEYGFTVGHVVARIKAMLE
jgi:transketolase